MAKKASLENFAYIISGELKQYANISLAEMKDIAQDVAKQGQLRLKRTSPKQKGKKSKKGHYADGWTVTPQLKGVNRFSFVINNKKKPGLTHLLENGHQLRQGGRAKPIPHIEPIERWCNQEYVRRVEKKQNDG